MNQYVCGTPCWHRRQKWEKGQPYQPTSEEAGDTDLIPHHFVLSDAYKASVVREAKELKDREAKLSADATRDTSSVDDEPKPTNAEKWDESMKPKKIPVAGGPDPEVYCSLCDTEFGSAAGLATHVKHKHPELGSKDE